MKAGAKVETWLVAGAFLLVKKPHYGWMQLANSDGSRNLTLLEKGKLHEHDEASLKQTMAELLGIAAQDDQVDKEEAPQEDDEKAQFNFLFFLN